MCGFLIGTACLIALVKVVRCGRRCGGGGDGGCGRGGWGGGRARCGHGGGHGGWGHGRWGHGRWGGGERGVAGERGGRGRGMFLGFLFRQLRTTPGQERVLFEVADELQVKLDEARGELDRTRRDLAEAVRGAVFDEERVKALTARQDELLRSLREAVQAGLKKVHGVLEPEQRELLARLLASGPWADLGADGYGPDNGPGSL